MGDTEPSNDALHKTKSYIILKVAYLDTGLD